MEITDYIIDIKDSSLQDRLRLRQVLLDNNQVIINSNPVPMHLNLVEISYSILADGTSWGTSRKQPNINIQDFISKFKVQDKLRNLVIYKRSGENWTESACKQIFEFLGDTEMLPQILDNKPIYESQEGAYYTWIIPPNSGLNIAYEDLFPKVHLMNPFKVGDIVQCTSKGTSAELIVGNIYNVKDVSNDRVYWHHVGSNNQHYSCFKLVESIKQGVKYPIFKKYKYSNEVIKFTGIRSGVRLVQGNATNKAGYQSCDFIDHTHHDWEPCDFTIEPEIFDIDWWDARFEAGLPVWFTVNSHKALKCNHATPPSKLFSEAVNVKFYTSDPSCQDTVEANQPNQTQKEQPMQHITIQQLLTRLFGAAMPTDYDRRPAYLVVAYNRDGSEMGTATAATIKQVKDKVADTPELWGCKVLVYKLDKEVSVKVPVTASEAKVAEPSDEE